MATLLDRFRKPPPTEDRHLEAFYTTYSTLGDSEAADRSYTTYASEGYGGSGPVFSLINRRVMSFSEAALKWRTPTGDLLDEGADLGLLRAPWPNGTLADLLSVMELDDNIAGNAFIWRDRSRLWRLRPDWTEFVHTKREPWELLGYRYWPGGQGSGEPVILDVADVAHFAPSKDPLGRWRGVSWLQSVAREVDADTAMSRHKLKFFESAATPNLAVKFKRPFQTTEQRDLARAEFNRRYAGGNNAWETMLLEGEVDIEVIGGTMRNAGLTELQAAGEARLASAAGVPPIVVGFSEGLEAATYSNYGQARRAFVDLTLRPLWQFAVGALDTIVTPPRRAPAGTHLWYDPSGVSLLQADEQDEATIKATEASTIQTLITAGYTPDSVVEAVVSGDMLRLEHTNLFSVQLQPPGQETNPELGSGGDQDVEPGEPDE